MQRREPLPDPTPAGLCRQAGFTLVEALVSLLVMAIVLVGLLSLLEFNSRLARAQINVADMQQSLRVAQADMVRQVRMAGRGGLPIRRPATAAGYAGMSLPTGPAVSIQNNVPEGTRIGNDADATVRPGTDVVTVRGVINTPLFQVDWQQPDGDVEDARADRGGRVIVRETTTTGVSQDLEVLKKALESNRPEALILVSPGNDEIHAVVQLTGGADNGDNVTLNFALDGTEHAEAYGRLSPGGEFPPGLLAVAMVGIVEEYSYYVRDDPADPQAAPSLTRAQLYPGTDLPYAGTPGNLQVALADNILDLQAVLAIDRGDDQTISDTNDANDDWLFNAAADSPVDENLWNATRGRALHYLRITALARTDRIDPKYVSPPIQAIEDHVYDEPDEPPTDEERLARSHRRRVLRTVVDLRNLS